MQKKGKGRQFKLGDKSSLTTAETTFLNMVMTSRLDGDRCDRMVRRRAALGRGDVKVGYRQPKGMNDRPAIPSYPLARASSKRGAAKRTTLTAQRTVSTFDVGAYEDKEHFVAMKRRG